MAERVSIPMQRLGGVVETIPFAKRMALIPDIFGQLDSAIAQAGFFYVGPQIALYHVDGDQMEVRVGVALDRDLPGFEMFDAPRADALLHTHRGGFDTLPMVYKALDAAVTEQGLTRGRWAREVYRQVARDPGLNVIDIYMDVL